MDVSISETAYLGVAIGAAQEGIRPIAELMFVDFFGVAMDQIYNQLAKNTYMSGGDINVPLVLTAGVGGTYNDAAHHSQTLYGIFTHIPGVKIVALVTSPISTSDRRCFRAVVGETRAGSAICEADLGS